MNFLTDKTFIWFVIKFLLVFAILYYGTFAVIGLTVPGGHYSPFVANYLDYIKGVRISLLKGSKLLMTLFGYDTYIVNNYNLRVLNGRGIRVEYQCLGFGVMSFWTAFVVASAGTIIKKIAWVLAGLVFLWLINITRLSLLLVATNKGWPMPLGLDHHSWFNIFAYLFIFSFIFLFNRQQQENELATTEKK